MKKKQRIAVLVAIALAVPGGGELGSPGGRCDDC